MTERPNKPSVFAHMLPITEPRPLVCEGDEKISLRFDVRAEQSSMYKHAPFDLVFSYTRLMMGFLLFQPAPRDILIIGLGGGSLSKYCYRYLPNSRITTVEISNKIIALRHQFAIPPEEERFHIVHADGADYIPQRPSSADVIMLDGYDADGLPRQLSSQYFYHQCVLALRDKGVLVANLLEGDRHMGAYLSRLRRAFGHKVMKARAERGYNQIVYALKHGGMPEWAVLRERALELEARHDMNFRTMVSKMEASI